MNPIQRQGDLILAQGTYVLVQDGASGSVEVVVGPHKVSLADTDKTVSYNPDTRRYLPNAADDAIRTSPTANEGQYIVLHNPEPQTNQHPSRGKTAAPQLSIGNKVNIPGPETFALYPGQYAQVIEGHQLRSNEYLLIRVYNEKAARTNLQHAIVKTTEAATEDKAKGAVKALINDSDLFTGNLMVIKGTDVSFYIPPTGIEVIADENGNYVRKAVTLERLEYCILLNQNGDKRYVQGPAVVFPRPTEYFVSEKNTNKFRAIELNENMGLYVKVIADYKVGNKSYAVGDELFITGKEQKIYYPREEHAIVKFGEEIVHSALAIPSGEGRYVLKEDTGRIDLVRGPKMYLPDPRKEVLVKRILDDKTVMNWFPGNTEALAVNRAMRETAGSKDFMVSEYASQTLYRSSGSERSVKSAGDKFTRVESKEPRSITLDTKYDGAININIWPGFAIQVVKKTGERSVEVGPKSVMLEYDETMEYLHLSTGRPKSDKSMYTTPYLQVSHNTVTDMVVVETKDLVNVEATVSYRVNFLPEHKEKWFTVSNYVKLLAQHTRSLLRNAAKKYTVEEFTNNATDIIRNTILGVAAEGKERPGRTFSENGMVIYDVEIINFSINDKNISNLLLEAQHDTVQQNLAVKKAQKNLEYTKVKLALERESLQETAVNDQLRADLKLQDVEAKRLLEETTLKIDLDKQATLNSIDENRRQRDKAKTDQELAVLTTKTELAIKEAKEKAEAVSPQLVQAIISLGNLNNNKILAENLKAQGGGLAGIFQQGGIEGLLATVKGTPLEAAIMDLFKVSNTGLTANKEDTK